MEVDLALLADHAVVTDDRKLVIVGVFKAIRVRAFPALHPKMSLALRLTARLPGEPGELRHAVLIRMIDPDGHDIVPSVTADIRLEHRGGGAEASLPIVLHIPTVELKTPGPHSVDVFIDKVFQERVLFTVEVTGRPDNED